MKSDKLFDSFIDKLISYFTNNIGISLSVVVSMLATRYISIVSSKTIRENIVTILTVMLGAIALLALFLLRLYWKYVHLNEHFGVLWDKKSNMRCMSCHKPLKYSSRRAHEFYCSDPDCNSKHILTTGTGEKINKQMAIDFIRSGKT